MKLFLIDNSYFRLSPWQARKLCGALPYIGFERPVFSKALAEVEFTGSRRGPLQYCRPALVSRAWVTRTVVDGRLCLALRVKWKNNLY